MKKFILSLMLLATTVIAADKSNPVAIVNPDIYCFKIEGMHQDLKKKYGEEPIFIGKSSLEEKVVTMVYANQETGSYTIIEYGEKVGCVLAVGTNMIYRMPRAIDQKMM